MDQWGTELKPSADQYRSSFSCLTPPLFRSEELQTESSATNYTCTGSTATEGAGSWQDVDGRKEQCTTAAEAAAVLVPRMA